MTATSSPQNNGKLLLADIGGTSARFALMADGTVGAMAHMAVDDTAASARHSARISAASRKLARSLQQFWPLPARSSRAVIDMFCAMLGSVAGNLALTLGARRIYWRRHSAPHARISCSFPISLAL